MNREKVQDDEIKELEKAIEITQENKQMEKEKLFAAETTLARLQQEEKNHQMWLDEEQQKQKTVEESI